MTTSSMVGPTRLPERVHLVDILRGFAILGILLVNLSGQPVYALVVDVQTWTNPLDQLAGWFVRVFAEGKFYPLFSMLFGWGLTMQMTRAEAKGVAFVPLYVRRLLVLLLIGLAHAFLVWEGDILVTYAVMGFVLLLFRHRSPKTLLIWSLIFLLIPTVVNAALLGLIQLGVMSGAGPSIEQGVAQTMEQYRAQAAQATRVYAEGSYPEILTQRVSDLVFLYASMLFFFIPNVVGMFLLGLYMGRQGILHHAEAHLPLFRRLLVWGLPIGLAVNFFYAYGLQVSNRAIPSLMTLATSTASSFGGPLLMLAYVAAISLLFQRAEWRGRLAALAPVGRMALTNYLTHSILFNVIFYSHGFGLYGQTGPAINLGLCLVIYVCQVVFSHWWLQRFQFGPAEWLWRSMTYLKPQPMRLPASHEVGHLGRAES